MTTAEIREHLAGLTYKPGWAWTLEEDEWEGPYVRFLVDVPDAYAPTETVTLGINSWLPPVDTREQLDKWLAWRIARIEIHESLEFLRREGRPVFDPHAQEVA
jgi:hypothetical protein